MELSIRKSESNDINFLEQLEKLSFPEFQQNNRRNISISLSSPFQEVWIVQTNEKKPEPVGAMTLFIYKKSVRIYSIATLPAFQNIGAGSFLLNQAMLVARGKRAERLLLEAHADNVVLLDWYRKRGFVDLRRVEDYYAKGEACVKMEFEFPATESDHKTKNLIVVNNTKVWRFTDINAQVISVKDFITNQEYHSDDSWRVFNLCSSYQYQSYGYYVSLLASARGQRVIPNVATIRDFSSKGVIRSLSEEVNELLDEALQQHADKKFSLSIFFGQTHQKGFKKVAMKLYQLFETPIFKVHFIKDEHWIVKRIEPMNINKVTSEELEAVNQFASLYFDKKRFNKARLTSFKYDLAILVNKQEATPPSCPQALNKFKKAANKRGIYAEFISKNDFSRINEFDALFIRETTSVNDHTYEISRLAYAEGLVVIDDPWSILRCSNKIYQNELFRSNNILTPRTTVYTKNLFQAKDLDNATFPLVLKQPDSAFSVGVTKVNSREETLAALATLFKKTDMVIAQEFTYSDFDWRIGILDNTPIYACKYYMTQGHWQIYNWLGKEDEEQTGNFETFDLKDVPQHVLKTAQKSASLIGDGLYGVDLKEIDGKVYVIEINDNPNIDAGVEDLVLKDKLYDIVIDSILNRIEISKNIKRYVS